ncbi:hypothetical protein B0H12DRAFT_1097451 [Mycena haematopus]|nr:hypothetical protein B0H12DRAFT_1097451 [Mycena haematopus]
MSGSNLSDTELLHCRVLQHLAVVFMSFSKQSSRNLHNLFAITFGMCSQTGILAKAPWMPSFLFALESGRWLSSTPSQACFRSSRPPGHGSSLVPLNPYSITKLITLRRPLNVDLTLPMFSALTHLDVFDSLHLESSSWTSWSSLALLPALTHLAFVEISYGVATAVLGICPKLQVIISMHNDARTHLHMLFATAKDIDDPELRFVSMVLSSEDYASDWETGIRGGSDFWARADAFVAMRHRGEIKPKSRYWIDHGDGI